MNEIYLVLVVVDSEVKNSEVFTYQHVALERACVLAHKISVGTTAWLLQNPDEEQLEDGASRWVFLETSKKYVAVHKTKVNSEDHYTVFQISAPVVPVVTVPAQLPGHYDTSSVGGKYNDYPVMEPQPDRYADKSPAGFDYNKKPLRMEDLVRDPFCCLETSDLTDAQRKALVKARIKFMRDYRFKWASGLIWTRDHTLLLLDGNSLFVDAIIDFECSLLDAHKETLTYEDESSSSSEDEY